MGSHLQSCRVKASLKEDFSASPEGRLNLTWEASVVPPGLNQFFLSAVSAMNCWARSNRLSGVKKGQTNSIIGLGSPAGEWSVAGPRSGSGQEMAHPHLLSLGSP